MQEFENLINSAELGRAGKIKEKNSFPGWNMDTEFVLTKR